MQNLVVKNRFGELYKVQLPREINAQLTLKSETFWDQESTQQFIRNLTVPNGYWREIISEYSTLPIPSSLTTIEIEQQVNTLMMRGQLKFYPVDIPDIVEHPPEKRVIKSTDNITYQFAPVSTLLLNKTSEIKSFKNTGEAKEFLSNLNANDEQLTNIANELDINLPATASVNQGETIEAMSQEIAAGNIVIIVDKTSSAPPTKKEALNKSDVGNRATSLGDGDSKNDASVKKTDDHVLVKILPNSGDHKQYVNLKSNSKDKSYGRYVEFEAHLNKQISGVTIYFRVIEHSNNNKKLPTRMHSKGLATSMKEEENILSATTNADGVAKINLKLSTFGGDKFQAIASLDAECSPENKGNKSSSWITVWRKLWYQLTHHKDLTPPSMSTSISKFKNVFIELDSETTVTHNKAVNGNIIVGSHNDAEYHAYHKNLHPGQSVHIILCDKQVDGTPSITIESEAEFTNDTNYIHATNGGNYIMFNPPLSGEKLLISGSWENISTKKSGALIDDPTKTSDDIGLFSYDNEDFVKIVLPINAEPTPEKPVKVNVSIIVASGPWGGDGGTAPHNLIVIDSNDTIHTMCVMHELGHLMNLGPLKERVNCPDGFKYEDHTKLYESNGAHCYSGGNLVTDSSGDKIGNNGTCIMYHQLNTSCLLEYCSYCAPFVKGMKLKKFKDLSK